MYVGCVRVYGGEKERESISCVTGLSFELLVTEANQFK